MAEFQRTCKRKGVGCSAASVSPDGYGLRRELWAINGPTERHGKDWCNGVKGACGCPHAEPKLMLKMERFGAYLGVKKVEELIIVCSYSPCTNCANVLLSSETTRPCRLVYGTLTEHDTRGRDILSQAGFDIVGGQAYLMEVANRTWNDLLELHKHPEVMRIYDTLDKWATPSV